MYLPEFVQLWSWHLELRNITSGVRMFHCTYKYYMIHLSKRPVVMEVLRRFIYLSLLHIEVDYQVCVTDVYQALAQT